MKNPRAQEMDLGKIENKLAERRHRLDQALAKIGATVTEYKEAEGRFTLMVRAPAPKDEVNAARWRLFIEKTILFSTTVKSWKLDFSKVFFAHEGIVRFLWRIVVTGEAVDSAKRVLAEIALETLAEGIEVTEVPLVGRVEYEHNPAKGKLKGAYGINSGGSSVADQLVGSLMAVTGGGGR